MTPDLFSPWQLGAMHLDHRIVMAPMSRRQAVEPGGLPSARLATWYAARSTPGGLLIAEASSVSARGSGQPGMTGIFTADQVNRWRVVTDAIHVRRGLVMAQLWHAGRLGVPPALAPSAIPAVGSVFVPSLSIARDALPVPANIDDIDAVIEQYRQAAENAGDAGFDGVEVHCANGCLLDQFLHQPSNQRQDDYGGTSVNRARLLVEVVDAVISVWGASRVGVRLSPLGRLNGMEGSDAQPSFARAVDELSRLEVAYLHVMEPRVGAGLVALTGSEESEATQVLESVRRGFAGSLIASGGFDDRSARTLVGNGGADAVSFGRDFIANADLIDRLREGRALLPRNPAGYFSTTSD